MASEGSAGTRLRITAVWVLLAILAVTVVGLRQSDVNSRRAAVDSQASAVAAQAASLMSAGLQDQYALVRAASESLLAGEDLDNETLAESLGLIGALVAAVIDVETEEILALALPGTTDDIEITTDVVFDYFPEAVDAFGGTPTVGQLANIAPGTTLVSLFVPYDAWDGSRRVLATGTTLDEAIEQELLAPGASEFTIRVYDVDHYESGEPVSLLQRGPDVVSPDIATTMRVTGTPWVLEASATYAQLGEPLGGLTSNIWFSVAIAALAAVALGAFASKAISDAAEIETAYQQVAWASRQQREFTAIIAHELRTPATTASGLSSILTERWSELSDTQRLDLADRVNRSTADLATLISDLRLARGFDAGPVSLSPSVHAAGQLVDRALTMAGLGFSDATVHGDLDATVLCDPRFAKRALSSILQNAKLHGDVPIEVLVLRTNDVVQFRVRDHGPGVPDSFVPHLFEPFTQAHSHMRRAVRGTGLGLHLVQAIVEQMGGTVFHEHADPGAIFEIRLPVADRAAVPTPPDDPDDDGLSLHAPIDLGDI